MIVARGLVTLLCAFVLVANASENPYTNAAQELDQAIAAEYAYLDKLPGGFLPQSAALRAKRNAVHDSGSLLAYAEARLASLADHHAITGSSFSDSWAIVPTYADLWVVMQDGKFVVDAVREDSPASAAQIEPGDHIVGVDGVPMTRAVADFWAEIGLEVTPARAEYAARILVAGRRDRDRHLTIERATGKPRQLRLPSLYESLPVEQPPVTVCNLDSRWVIRFNNSLTDNQTIAAFDAAMRRVPEDSPLVLDLRDTPSGGNTAVARAIMGWFVSEPRGYQIHNRPEEERLTGIARQWIEQVLPRNGLRHDRLPIVRVGRWTGSMGEGIAVGFASMGAQVQGTKMAGLNGSIEDIRVGDTDLYIKLPTEKLLTTWGQPREDFVPQPIEDTLPSKLC